MFYYYLIINLIHVPLSRCTILTLVLPTCIYKKNNTNLVTVAHHNRECFLRQNCCLNCILIIEFHYARMTEVSNRCTALCLSIRICLHKKSRPYLNTIQGQKHMCTNTKMPEWRKKLKLVSY